VAGHIPYFHGIYTTRQVIPHTISIYEKVYRQPPPEGHFLLANFSQKFDQKLASDPKGSFYEGFVKKS